MADNCGPQLSCQVHHGYSLLSFCCMLELLYKEKCAGKTIDSSDIHGLFDLYMKRLETNNKCLTNPHFPYVSLHFHLCFLMFHVVFLLFPWAFSMFSQVFPSVSSFGPYETWTEKPLHSGHFYSKGCYGRHSFFGTT